MVALKLSYLARECSEDVVVELFFEMLPVALVLQDKLKQRIMMRYVDSWEEPERRKRRAMDGVMRMKQMTPKIPSWIMRIS
jgi:hypothetical protein